MKEKEMFECLFFYYLQTLQPSMSEASKSEVTRRNKSYIIEQISSIITSPGKKKRMNMYFKMFIFM